MTRAKKVEPEAPRETIQITIDKAEFIKTRDALVTSWLTLEGALKDATRAYIAHSNAVVGGNENLDVNQLDLTSFLEARNALAVIDAAGGKPKRAKRAPKDPNAPKRPLTAYLLWLGDNRTKIHDELGPEQKRGQISSEGTKQWHALPEATKQIYKDTYNRNNEKYVEEMKEYKVKFGDVPVEDVEEEAVADPEEAVEEPIAEDAKPPVADTDASTTSDDSDSDSDSDDDTPVPPKEPTPPPVKTPKSAKSGRKKATKAAAEPPASSPPLPASSPSKGKSFAAVNGSQGSKRKAKADAEAPAEEPKPKRGRKNAAPAPAPAEEEESTPATVKKEKKTRKGRKSLGGDA